MTRSRDLANLADGVEFLAADHTKLDGIEASADVTDATNVTAAGALMDSELTNLAAVKAINQSLVTTATPTFAGLATTANVTFADNDKAIFGDDSDLEIKHTGTHAYMSNTTGNTYLQGGGQFRVQSASGENHFIANADGAVNLYYDNALKLATTSTGIDISGTVTADDIVLSDPNAPSITLTDTTNTVTTLIQSGNSSSTIGTTTSHALNFVTNNADAMIIDSAGHLVTKGGVSIDDGGSTGPEFSRDRAQNLKIKGQSGGDVGITAYNASNEWAFQLYGGSSSYGFLEANWAAWDLQKYPNGKLYLNGNTTYYLQPETTTKLNNVQVGGIDFGTSGAASETLDGYEEGEYTPLLYGYTTGSGTLLPLRSTHNVLSYTKVGRKVTVNGKIETSGSHSAQGSLLLSVPFTSANLTDQAGQGAGACFFYRTGQLHENPTVIFGENVAYVYFFSNTSGGDVVGITADVMDAAIELVVGFTYFTT